MTLRVIFQRLIGSPAITADFPVGTVTSGLNLLLANKRTASCDSATVPLGANNNTLYARP